MGRRASRLGIVLLVGVGLLSLAGCLADAPPGNPTAVAGDNQATVSWTTPIGDTGALVTKYMVTPFMGSELVPQTPVVFNSTATTQTITGLISGTTYRFRVHAINGLGNESAGSVLSNPVTATGIPRYPGANLAHSCAVGLVGSVRCWGLNANGQLGNGTTVDSSVSVPVAGMTGSTISVGGAHTCGLLTDDTAKCWGWNAHGQLGNGLSGDGTDSNVPVAVTGLTGVTAIAAGFFHTCAVLTGGTVACWGYNSFGQLGNGQSGVGSGSSTPVAVTGLTGVTAIAAGGNHTCALLAAGTVKCWGRNHYGQLGNGSLVNSNVPVAVTGITTATAITAGLEDHTCSLVVGGAIKCWGYNGYGALGNGLSGRGTDSSTPVAVAGITNAAAVAAGGFQTCALLTDGTAKCWGWNTYGGLGNGTLINSNVPVAVTGLTGATAITAGGAHTCAQLVGGAVKCWGWNAHGQLGNGTFTNSSTPVAVIGL